MLTENSVYGWTSMLTLASQRPDPSGVQSVGTSVQTMLLPGLSTVTRNVRYLTLFTGAQYWRHYANEQGHTLLKYRDFLRRFEALIALSSILHHEDTTDPPLGIVGRQYADNEVLSPNLRLDTKLSNPPYNIYRGTLGELELFDLTKPDDPLHESAKTIGQSWNIDYAGKIGEQIKQGILPENMRRSDLKVIASTFCLCSTPHGSDEQRSIVELLFGLSDKITEPKFSLSNWNNNSMRVASWRLLLEVIERSALRRLDNHYLMARLLENDLLDSFSKISLKKTLLLWRWVASRSFFELGWTYAFLRAFEAIRPSKDGLYTNQLEEEVKEKYRNESGTDTLSELTKEVEDNKGNGLWIAEKFDRATLCDCIRLMICGAITSKSDLIQNGFDALEEIDAWPDIPFIQEREVLTKAIQTNTASADYWASITIKSIVQHTFIALRKMSQGTPDTQHIDFENSRWVVPPYRDGWRPNPSTGFSRLDIGIGWLQQLGLVIVDNQGYYSLTPFGKEIRGQWDRTYSSWV